MILPTMYGWIVQIYGYSPGDAKVWEKVSSVSSAADLNAPFLSPIRCGLSSSFFQVTVVPVVTASVVGAKVKLSILMVAGLAAAATTASPAEVSWGRAAATSTAMPIAPSVRPRSRSRGATLLVVNIALPLKRSACCRSGRERLAAHVVDRPNAKV